MRVDNGGVNAPGAGYFTRTDTATTKETRNTSGLPQTLVDHSSLRATDELVGLAKTLPLPGLSERMSSISAAVSRGAYKSDPESIGQAVVNDHIQS
jgi:hypothetical protein